MAKHITDNLHNCFPVIVSDEDQPIVMEIHVGFNPSEALTVSVDYIDYDEPEYNCSTAAVVNETDAHEMARHHKVKYSELPHFIAECMAPKWDIIINPDSHQVRECFKEITECLLDEGCRFTIERTYGPNEFTCL